MSRHEIAPLNTGISCVAIGWERGFGSFYFQMYRTDNACPFDTPDDEIGLDFEQITDPKKIIDAVRPYAHIPDDLNQQLTADKAREGTCEFPAAVQLMNAIPPAVNWDEVPIPF